MIDFEKGAGLVPAIVQDSRNHSVLMLGYLSKESWDQTLKSRKVCFYSRSKQRLWTKGESSGNFLQLQSYQVDCDRDTVLLQVIPLGPVCHTGDDTCFGKRPVAGFVHQLEAIIKQRLAEDSDQSYTAKLMARGINKVAQKLGEEAVELVIEAKDNDQELFLNEAADLMYHYLLLLQAKGHDLAEVEAILDQRHQASGAGK